MQDYSMLKRKDKRRPDWREIDAIRKAHFEAQKAQETKNSKAAKQVKAEASAKAGKAAETPLTPIPGPGGIPSNWREMGWPFLRDLAEKLAGREMKSRAEARAIIMAHEGL
jgi:hypothetical protein